MGVFYYPSNQTYTTPDQFGLTYTEHWIIAKDQTKLHAWHIPSTVSKRKGLIVQLHGNAQNLSSHFLSLAWVLEEGYDLFIFDYRGYGLSEGKPSPSGIRWDTLAALSYAKTLYSPIIAWGQSLGGAVLLDAITYYPKSQKNISHIVIESSFLSYQGIARAKLANHWLTWLLQPLAYVLLNDTYSAKNKLNLLKIPLLIMHGDSDNIVPLAQGEQIYAQAREPKKLIIAKKADHLHVTHVEEGKYRKEIMQFLRFK